MSNITNVDNTNSTAITYEKVLANANKIREYSSEMNTIFSDFTSTINQVGSDDVFMGKASEALKSKFNSLKGKFDAYTSKVEQFANMISSASEQTEMTEKSIASDADTLAG